MSVPYYRRKRKRLKLPKLPHRHHHHHSHRSHHRKKPWQVMLIVAATLVVICGVAFAGYEALKISGKSGLEKNSETSAPDLTAAISEDNENTPATEEGIYYYNGKKYKYNSEIVTILCMGIDTQDVNMEEDKKSGQGGQADTIILAVLNPTESKMEFISISRDTMTDVETYDYTGNYIGDSVNHLGLGYAFGDGNKKSCEIMQRAVANLFYDLPIHGYCAIDMGALVNINNAVGGVPLVLSEDLNGPDYSYKAGETVTLDGEQALSYIRSRDTEKMDSNSARMERQKQYAYAFLNTAKGAVKDNLSIVTDLYSELTGQMVTNLGLNEVTYLASQAVNMGIHGEDMVALKGEPKKGAVYDEFYVDDKALLELILDVFYQEVKE